ncbi:MAG: polysaccharide biosynthesis tyrosine autokinase [Sphingobacteriales bacterium]|nr:MAG: polysaccharide biosynthesis tyrosine autokinase [Sphingobacteriales bacterium]
MSQTKRELPIKTEANLLNQLWFKYAPYWPVFFLLVALSIGAGWFYLRYKVPVFEANATILIKDEKKGLDDSKMMESLNQLATKKIIENEIEVLKSRSLMTYVANSLGLYAPIFEEGKMVTRSAYVISPLKIIASQPDSLKGAFKVYFRLNRENRVVIANQSFPLNEWVETPFGKLKFISNSRYNGSHSLLPMFFNLGKPKDVAGGLIGALTVNSVNKQSTLISLYFQDEVPERAEDILNELIIAYNKAAIDDKNTLANNTLAFVEDRLRIVAKELDSIEFRLQQYKAVKGATDISAQSRMFLESVSTNDHALSNVNIQLSVLDQVENYLLAKNGKGGLVPSTLGINDPVLTQLLDKLYASELEYERLKLTTGENSPVLLALSEQINKLKPSILENIRSQKRGLEASRQNLYANNGAYNSMLRSIPQKERDLVEINRAQSIKSNIYTFLLQKREETALSHSSAVADSRVVDKAQSSPGPISPDKRKIYMVSIVFGFALGIGFVSGKDLLNKNILFRHEIEDFTSMPIVGELIQQKTKEPLIIGYGKNGLIAEQFRKIRSSLRYLGLNEEKKKILVTSSISKEGKSFVVANLGLSLAMAGKRVVLLELDLVNPTLSAKLNTQSITGISDYLEGRAAISDLINKTEAHENLFIIGSGPLPENPSELIMNRRLEILLSALTQQFDFIIIDSAPVYALSDAYILSPLCDATLYVVRHAHTPKVLVQRLDENNKVNELHNPALIFNGIRSRGFSKENYGYGYVYHEKIKNQKRSKPVKPNLYN